MGTSPCIGETIIADHEARYHDDSKAVVMNSWDRLVPVPLLSSLQPALFRCFYSSFWLNIWNACNTKRADSGRARNNVMQWSVSNWHLFLCLKSSVIDLLIRSSIEKIKRLVFHPIWYLHSVKFLLLSTHHGYHSYRELELTFAST